MISIDIFISVWSSFDYDWRLRESINKIAFLTSKRPSSPVTTSGGEGEALALLAKKNRRIVCRSCFFITDMFYG